MKKKAIAATMLFGAMVLLAGCEAPAASGTDADTANTTKVAANLAERQPTPTDIDFSLERYNLTRRAYWVNGQREKAKMVPCAVTKPLGYVVLFTESGSVVGSFIVDGKVSSLNSYLTPDSEVYEIGGESTDVDVWYNGTTENDWLADVDGSYGKNDNGIFFFTPDGKYIEWTGTYLYSDIPFEVDNPVVRYEVK